MILSKYSQITNNHSTRGLHPWPSSKDPTPYEIFDMEDGGKSTLEMNQQLKSTYLKYVKLYHPDVAHDVADKSGRILSGEAKRIRFDQIQNAYDILKDPRRRVAYNRYYNSKWDPHTLFDPGMREEFSKANFQAFRKAQSHRNAYSFNRNEQFWHAGTWEDYYRMKYKKEPPTKEEIDRNKIKILIGVVIFGALAFSLQFMMALERVNEYQHKTRVMNMKLMQDLRGDDANKLERMQHFLDTRRSTLAVKEDQRLLRKYAVKQVEKWDDDPN
ncbi:uncharacterized protein CANTADRAFT_97202 [Suhomyces tanzawaensis NRRL Y-17324]|uniref:J domain-containing protein n=1 Tax=Suhomyces tanzawaensis NRRL Y-17324 TaxID=984487 RepID=A0A1E4SDI9_9ASCO|nr:uncharacterized protein CANTADRAFT_97202 [Suhomyces tanzawaensis NRRL Y-17324]ODV77565.1 hypothetical protein CANTADRAFT_97202 [Suhomyces tanzawaensis NRRL Y-17324]